MSFDIDLSNIDITSLQQATDIANMCSRETGAHFIPIDHGDQRTPRYTIMRVPDVGIDVRAACNGKAQDDGIVIHVTEDVTLIKTSGGHTYERVGNTACWINENGWSLICGRPAN